MNQLYQSDAITRARRRLEARRKNQTPVPDAQLAHPKPEAIKQTHLLKYFPNYTQDANSTLRKPVPFAPFPPTHFANEYQSLVPSLDQFEHYYPNPAYLEAFALAMHLNHRTALFGPPGTSKTSLVHYYAAHKNQPVFVLQGSAGITEEKVLGQTTLHNKEIIWCPSVVEQTVLAGGILLIDEANKIPPSINIALQPLYEPDGVYICPGHLDPSKRQIKPHSDFRLVITDNISGTISSNATGSYTAAEIQDSSTISRYQSVIFTDYPTPVEEATQLIREFNIKKSSLQNLERFVHFCKQTREAWVKQEIDIPITRREARAILTLTPYLGRRSAIQTAYINKLGTPEQKAAVQIMYNMLFHDGS